MIFLMVPEENEEADQVFLGSCWPLIMLYSRVQAVSEAPSFLHSVPPIMPPFVPTCPNDGLSLAVTLATVMGLLAVVKEPPSVPF